MSKLRLQSFLIRQSYVLSWSDILDVSEQFFESYEYNVWTWDDWDGIEKYLTQLCEQARMSALARPAFIPAAQAPPSQSAGAPTKPKAEGGCKGVPWRYMKAKGICCGFNSGSCETVGDHNIKGEKVSHWCGGCYAAKGIKDAHRVKDCNQGPWAKSLFA